MYGLLLETSILPPSHMIAFWAIKFDSIPWVEFAIINFIIFMASVGSDGIIPGKNNGSNISKQKKEIYISRNKIYSLSFIFVTFVMVEFLITVSIYGSLSEFIQASYSRTALEDTNVNFIFPLLLFCNVLSVIIFSFYINERYRDYVRYYIPFIISQVIYCFFAGGRSIALLLLISLIIVKYKTIKNIGINKFVVGIFIFAVISGTMISKRFETQGADAYVANNFISIIEAAYTGLPMIDHLGLSIKYVEENGYDYGDVYINSVLFFIPRSIWVNKPLQLSRLMRENFYGDTTGGIPPGLFGESYIAFGWVGVFIIAVLYGFLIRFLDKIIIDCPLDIFSRLRLAVIPTLFGFILVRGGVDIGIYRVGLIIFLYFLMESYIRVKVVYNGR
ncbi:hypothetical protein GCM10009411_16240 [Shewanella litoralis]|uniref:Oligosaccharide repeat unit polymerase n=2 Tax=Shewanella litoralis TaxID=2282700 RepID=A0ABQ2RAG1_9GAMM|nr:hypothetical protein GCM10009411_16240 [Shewanella litoralis]